MSSADLWPVTLTWYRRLDRPRDGLRVQFDADELRHLLAHPGPLPVVDVGACRPDETEEDHAKRVMRARKAELPALCVATYRDDYRLAVNTEGVTMLGLDIDTVTDDPAALLRATSEALGGVEVFGYTTASSKPGAFKSRGLVPPERPATQDEHAASWRLAKRVLARAGITIDPVCSDTSRGFYVPTLPDSGAYWHGHVPGAPWPVGRAAEVERARLERERAERERAARLALAKRAAEGDGDRVERARWYLAKCEPGIEGANGSRATFLAAAKVLHGFDLTEDETLMLMASEYNPRCRPPWSDRELARKVHEAATKGRDFVRGSLLATRRAS